MVNQERLKAYVDIVQGLLSCPKGEEWILLRQYQELVNPELVEVIEQVAHHLTVKGDIKAGKYLHNWAGKLHHILLDNVPISQENQEKTQAYIEFVQALLDCTDDCSESEIVAAHEDLIDPGLIKMMRHIASKLAVEGDQSSADYLHEMAADLNAVWLHKHKFEPSFKPEIAADPWLDEESDAPDLPQTANNSKSLENLPSKKAQESVLPSTQPEVKKESPLIQQLKAIANSLDQLETTLATKLQPANPLWYMDVLEQALANNWILTTEEVEHLTSIKPHCRHDETTYQRGCWVFVKAGKIGTQLGWQVQKKIVAKDVSLKD